MRFFYNTKTTGKYSSFPFIAMFFNCTIASIYGILIDDLPLLITNYPCAIISVIYMLMYWKYADAKPRMKSIVVAFFALAIVVGLGVLAAYIPKTTREMMFGIIMCCTGIIMYGSPLTKMYDVIRTRSTNGMPFYFSLTDFICTTVWMIYGYMIMNVFIIIPNTVGAILSLIQLSLFTLFGSKLHLIDYLPQYHYHKTPSGQPLVNIPKATVIRVEH